jgi:flagellar biosynthesis/type III secretory pathway chaperone
MVKPERHFGAMTNPQKTILVATLTAVICISVYEVRRASRLRRQLDGLQQQQAPLLQQVQQLQQERDDAKRQLVAVRDEKERSDQNTAELLRLRGDVGVLGRQLAEANLAKTQPSAPMAQASQPADMLEQEKRTARIKGIDGKNYSAHILSVAWENQGLLPTNWQQVARFTNSYPVTGTNEFELIHKGPVNLAELGTNAERTVLVREFMAWPTVDGQWGKIYGFADGHSLIVRVPDGNFTAWEEQNTYNPESILK